MQNDEERLEVRGFMGSLLFGCSPDLGACAGGPVMTLGESEISLFRDMIRSALLVSRMEDWVGGTGLLGDSG